MANSIFLIKEIFNSERGCSKRPAFSPALTQVRQDTLFHGQGRRGFGTHSVLEVREGERREEREV